MTNEERENAIRCLKLWIEREPQIQTYKTCLEALEQQPCERFEWGIDGKVYKITKAKDGKEICQQVCDDAISRQYLLDNCVIDKVTMPYVPISKIENALSVTPQEPKTGHWSRKTKVDAYDIAGVKTWGIKCQCDRCDFTTIVVEDFGYYKYCPNCGCRMVEPQESEDKV